MFPSLQQRSVQQHGESDAAGDPASVAADDGAVSEGAGHRRRAGVRLPHAAGAAGDFDGAAAAVCAGGAGWEGRGDGAGTRDLETAGGSVAGEDAGDGVSKGVCERSHDYLQHVVGGACVL